MGNCVAVYCGCKSAGVDIDEDGFTVQPDKNWGEEKIVVVKKGGLGGLDVRLEVDQLEDGPPNIVIAAFKQRDGQRGAAEKNGNLAVGDALLEVDGKPVPMHPITERPDLKLFVEWIKASDFEVKLKVKPRTYFAKDKDKAEHKRNSMVLGIKHFVEGSPCVAKGQSKHHIEDETEKWSKWMEAVTRGDYEAVKTLVIYHWGSINRTEPQQGNGLLAVMCREG